MGKREREQSLQFKLLHQAYYDRVAPTQDILLIENVPEYSEALVLQCLNKGRAGTWQLESVRLDPRLFGLGCARARVFMIVFKKRLFAWTKKFTLQQFVETFLSTPGLCAESYFWSKKNSLSCKLSDCEESWQMFTDTKNTQYTMFCLKTCGHLTLCFLAAS